MKNHFKHWLLRRTDIVSNETSASARDWIDADMWLRRSPGLRLIAGALLVASIPCAAIILLARVAELVSG